MQAIYKPKGRAGEYCSYAVNVYTGCNHGCDYCYARKMANRWGRDFTDVSPRAGILETAHDCQRVVIPPITQKCRKQHIEGGHAHEKSNRHHRL